MPNRSKLKQTKYSPVMLNITSLDCLIKEKHISRAIKRREVEAAIVSN